MSVGTMGKEKWILYCGTETSTIIFIDPYLKHILKWLEPVMLPTNILTILDWDEVPLAEEINCLNVLETSQTTSFMTYNVYVWWLMVWHMNEGVVIERFLDENWALTKSNKKYKADIWELVT